MEAKPVKFLNFLRTATQFEVPIYQRTYSWRLREYEQLWNDVMRSGRDDSVDAHFMGAVVYIQSGLYQVADNKSLLVIDGQQRLTTVMLLLEALARALGDAEPVDGFSASKIRNRYLLDPDESGDKRFKLLLTETDRASLLALVQRWDWPPKHSVLLKQSFDYFTTQIDQLGADVTTLCKGLDKLVVVDIALDRTKDNPQLIFESMNSTGRALSPNPPKGYGGGVDTGDDGYGKANGPGPVPIDGVEGSGRWPRQWPGGGRRWWRPAKTARRQARSGTGGLGWHEFAGQPLGLSGGRVGRRRRAVRLVGEWRAIGPGRD